MKIKIVKLMLFLILILVQLSFSSDKKNLPFEKGFYHNKVALGSNTYQIELCNQPINYLNQAGKFEKIEKTWIYQNGEYVNTKNLFITKVSNEEINLTNPQKGFNLSIIGFKVNGRKIKPIETFHSGNDTVTLIFDDYIRLELVLAAGRLSYEWRLKPKEDFIYSSVGFVIKNNDLKMTEDSNGIFLLNRKIHLSNPYFIDSYKSEEINLNVQNSDNNDKVLTITIPQSVNSSTLSVQGDITENLGGGFGFSMNKNGQSQNELQVFSYESSENAIRYLELWGIDHIPEQADIKSAYYELELTAGQNDDSPVSVVQPGDLAYVTSDAEKWTKIGQGTEYHSFNPKDIGDIYSHTYYKDDYNNSFCADIEQRIKDKHNFDLGFKLKNESNYGYVTFKKVNNKPVNKLIITYEMPPNTLVKNKFTGGKVFVDDMENEKNAPYETYKKKDSEIILKAKDEQFADEYVQLFSKWTTPDNEESLSIQFTDNIPKEDNNNYKAMFDRQFDITVNYYLINGGSCDPDLHQGREYHESTIVVDEEKNDVDVNGRSIDYHFSNWSNGEKDNPYTFIPGDHTDLTAVYKGHLASNNSRATGYNNGRRIAREPNGTLHAVYEDGGKIWYTYSSDAGATWAKETKLDDTFPAKNPSLDFCYNAANLAVHVVYESIIPKSGGGEAHVITWQQKNNSGWQSPEYIENGTFDYLGDWDGDSGERPTILANEYDNIWAAWRDLSSGRIKIRSYTPSQNWGTIGEVNNSNGYPVIGRCASGDLKTKIIWAQDGQIKYISGDYLSGDWSWTSVASLSNYPLMFNSERPSMTVKNGRYGHITWDANFDFGGERCLYYQIYDFYNNAEPWWSYPSELAYNGSDVAFNPSISLNHSTDIVSIYYEQSGNIYRKKHDNGSWSKTGYSSGKYPAAAKDGGSGAIWTKYNEAPYLIKSDYVSPSNPVSPIVPGWKFKYQLTAAENNGQEGFIQFEIIGISFDNQILNFNRELTSDSLVANASVIPVDVQLAVSYHQVNVPLNSEELLLKVDFVEGSNIIPLTDVRYYELPANNTVFQKSVNKNNLHTRYGNVHLSFGSREPLVIYTLTHEDSTVAKESQRPFAGVIPEKHLLTQNFPNPFNPLTNFRFELPRDEVVQLTVYNVNGQKIKELINGHRPAGIHEVLFDGSALPSGVYFYRLSTGSYTATKRMLLIK